jgi:hypothetical protein
MLLGVLNGQPPQSSERVGLALSSPLSSPLILEEILLILSP